MFLGMLDLFDRIETTTAADGVLKYEFWKVLNPSQIIGRLTFLIPSLTIRLIQKFVQNITSFVVAWWFINKSCTCITNLG